MVRAFPKYLLLLNKLPQNLVLKQPPFHCIPLVLWVGNLGRALLSSREGNGTPLQHSCLENPMDRGAWWAAVPGVAKTRTQLSDFTFTFHFPALEKEMATHSSVLAWRIPGTVESGGLPSIGSHRAGSTEATEQQLLSGIDEAIYWCLCGEEAGLVSLRCLPLHVWNCSRDGWKTGIHLIMLNPGPSSTWSSQETGFLRVFQGRICKAS